LIPYRYKIRHLKHENTNTTTRWYKLLRQLENFSLGTKLTKIYPNQRRSSLYLHPRGFGKDALKKFHFLNLPEVFSRLVILSRTAENESND
jgi:hypothetical protein